MGLQIKQLSRPCASFLLIFAAHPKRFYLPVCPSVKKVLPFLPAVWTLGTVFLVLSQAGLAEDLPTAITLVWVACWESADEADHVIWKHVNELVGIALDRLVSFLGFSVCHSAEFSLLLQYPQDNTQAKAACGMKGKTNHKATCTEKSYVMKREIKAFRYNY